MIPIVRQNTAPDNPNVVWIDTKEMKIKIFSSNGWTPIGGLSDEDKAILDNLKKEVDNLLNLDESDAIDNLKEIKEFLEGFKDDESLKEFIKGYYNKEEVDELIESHLYKEPDTNGYEYVDMGEAGIWAKYPIGVTEWNEEALDKIKYFEWGGIEGYTASQVGVDKQFSWSDYKFSGEDASQDNPQLTKYCSNPSYGKLDNLRVLLPEDDACVQNMGGSWRMPTKEEFQTLYNLCNNERVTDYNGVSGLNGWLFKLKTDESKQLFFPFSGYSGNGLVQRIGDVGYFSSSSLYQWPNGCYALYFGSNNVYPNNSIGRCSGCPIIGFMPSLPNEGEKYLRKSEASETYYTKEEVNDKISNIDLSDIESKLEGVTKAADDSEVIKRIGCNNREIFPIENGTVYMNGGSGIICSADGSNSISISADTDYLATKEDVNRKANDGEVIKALRLGDDEEFVVPNEGLIKLHQGDGIIITRNPWYSSDSISIAVDEELFNELKAAISEIKALKEELTALKSNLVKYKDVQ